MLFFKILSSFNSKLQPEDTESAIKHKTEKDIEQIKRT